MGSAQQRWPEYNRIVILGTTLAGAAVIIAAAIAEAVGK